jgi:RNA polymerase sigma factor (sigma-70 family)
MPTRRLDSLLRAAISFRRQDPRSDAELLARFLNDRDERAFEALLLRHAPAVRAACRVWLRSAADVDDAAQATFLVLVQRGGSIRDRAVLGPWLYRVALNVSRRLRRRQPASCPLPEDVPGRGPPDDSDLRELLAEEVARLPEKYRQPVLLCYLAGLTTAEVAQHLGWPKGTVLTRLAWAREQLKKRLASRGVTAGALAGLLVPAAPAVGVQSVSATARAAALMLAGEPLAGAGASERAVSLAKGVVRAMVCNRLKYVAVAALLALGGIGPGLHHWATASGGPGAERARPVEGGDVKVAEKVPAPEGKEKGPRGPLAAPAEKDGAKKAEARPGRRREAVIRAPLGTFVKEVNVAPYGSGRLTWTYEEERVLGLIEVSVMGGELELATEAEYSLSSNGTIYGLITSVQLKHLRLPEGKDFDKLKPFVGAWSAAEPLVNEVVTDLPFSYQFRVQGNRLILSNFRMLLAGPNPLGKLGGLTLGKEVGGALTAFQALGAAVEGTYTLDDGKERPAPNRRRPLGRPGTGADANRMK